MTSLDKIIDEVKASLESDGASVTIDADAYYGAIGHQETKFCSVIANSLAKSLICSLASRYATVEEFERGDTNEVMVYVIAANTMQDWRTAAIRLRGDVVSMFRQPAKVVVHHIIETRIKPDHP